MTYNVQKIREEVKRLKEETSIGLSEYENGIEQGRMEIINALSLFLDSLQEEPVSEDLGEYISKLAKQFPDVSFAKLSRIAVKVAKWQKEKDQKK